MRILAVQHSMTGNYLDEYFANEGGSEEVPEGHQEVATADSTQVKGSVGPGSKQQYAVEAMPVCIQTIHSLLVRTES